MQDLITAKWKYSFDTSAFIEPWKRIYPIDLFPKVWDFVKDMIKSHKIVSSIMVKNEIFFQEDNLTNFIKQFKSLFIMPNENVQNLVRQLTNNPDFDKWGIDSKNEADPFVVGLAKDAELTVVSYENPRATKNSIPAACKLFGIPHLSLVEVLRNEGFREE